MSTQNAITFVVYCKLKVHKLQSLQELRMPGKYWRPWMQDDEKYKLQNGVTLAVQFSWFLNKPYGEIEMVNF